MLGRINLSLVLLAVGGALTLVGFAAYFFGLRHAESGRFFFTAFPYFWEVWP